MEIVNKIGLLNAVSAQVIIKELGEGDNRKRLINFFIAMGHIGEFKSFQAVKEHDFGNLDISTYEYDSLEELKKDKDAISELDNAEYTLRIKYHDDNVSIITTAWNGGSNFIAIMARNDKELKSILKDISDILSD